MDRNPNVPWNGSRWYSHIQRLPGRPLSFHFDDREDLITLQDKEDKKGENDKEDKPQKCLTVQ